MINKFSVTGSLRLFSQEKLVVLDDNDTIFGEIEIVGPAVEIFYRSFSKYLPLSNPGILATGQLLCKADSEPLRAANLRCARPDDTSLNLFTLLVDAPRCAKECQL